MADDGPRNMDEAMTLIEKLQKKNHTLSEMCASLQWKLAVAQTKKGAVGSMGFPSITRGRAKNLPNKLSEGMDRVPSSGGTGVYKYDRQDMSNMVRLSFDNTTAEDIKKEVLTDNRFKEGPEGLMAGLKVSQATGISDKEQADRMEKFGENVIPMEPQTSIFSLMWGALQDPTLIFLCFASFVSLFIGVFVEQDPMGWLEGTAILTAVVVVVLVGSVNDYQKESQFRALNAKKDDMTVTVLRDGQKNNISCHKVVVGDIVLLSTGDIVSCDCYTVGRNDLMINEKMLTGETVMKKKGPYELSSSGHVVYSPIIFSGTFVQEGEGKAIVIAVGTSTYAGTMQKKMDEAEEGNHRSILQQKLDDMTEVITQGGAGFAILTVGVLCVRMYLAFQAGLCCKEEWDHHVHWSEVLSYLISGVTIFVVAVPEGLPLAVTIALAFSVKKMLKDQNLVRHLSACETMGSATTICSDKTGTLTTSRMSVVKVYCGGTEYSISDAAKLPEKLRKELIQSAVINTMAKTNLQGVGETPVYTGNDTECGLLAMANALGAPGKKMDYGSEDQPYKAIRRQFPEDQAGRKQFTFSSERKRMSTRVKDGSSYRIYTKGAAEMVMELCNKRYTPTGEIETMTNTQKAEINKVIERFADEALRTLCLAVRTTSDAVEDVNEAEKDLIMVALIGIEDPVRDEVPAAIEDCKKAGIVVRMVTGDNMKTAAAIAKKCGILDSVSDVPGAVIDGKTFREKVSGPDGKLNQVEFDKIWPQLRVMGRSTPLDKHMLVSGLQASTVKGQDRQTVAVTGDGTNDAPALKKADVGFAMGLQGTDVAKNASDVIIMDDNFVSIVKAVMWGRCVYDNICRFLQFQLTVNITAIVVACVGSAVLTQSPLTAIQMLWVNLIMDSFASLALATEDPTRSLLFRKPYPRDRGVLSQTMIKNMVLHAAWQLVILGGLIFMVGDICIPSTDASPQVCTPRALSKFVGFYGSQPFNVPTGRPLGFDLAVTAASGACPMAFDLEDKNTWKRVKGVVVPNRHPEYCKSHKGGEESATQHYTIVFNVFVLMQIFNEVNSRKIHNEWNVFSGIHKNFLFLFIVIGTLVAQVALIEMKGLNIAFGCTSLTADQWVISMILGLSVLPINLLFRLVPSSIFPGST